jgi:hypothetical protein
MIIKVKAGVDLELVEVGDGIRADFSDGPRGYFLTVKDMLDFVRDSLSKMDGVNPDSVMFNIERNFLSMKV